MRLPILLLALAAFGLSACTTPMTVARPASAPAAASSPTGRGPDVSAESQPRSSATTALLAQSRNDRANGDLGAAAATIERALSITPDDPLLWIELAEIRIAQGDRAGGEEMARKALTLTNSDTALAGRARALIR